MLQIICMQKKRVLYNAIHVHVYKSHDTQYSVCVYTCTSHDVQSTSHDVQSTSHDVQCTSHDVQCTCV